MPVNPACHIFLPRRGHNRRSLRRDGMEMRTKEGLGLLVGGTVDEVLVLARAFTAYNLAKQTSSPRLGWAAGCGNGGGK